ncbi:MAG: SOS response-associated peptidase [Betaproteobacteria bacterium]|nr:SOS response-associated peptidase [Betaproteobacteria bacterium]
MCGRYVTKGEADIEREWNLRRGGGNPFRASFNAAPTQMLPAVRNDPGRGRTLDLLRWGLIPSWSKDPSIGNRLINARAETVATKPAFRAAYKARRCLVPARGCYEWKVTPAGKVPHFITTIDDSLMAFAGLWEHWKPVEGDPIESYTMLTTEPNTFARAIHNRMPVIVEPEDYDEWLTSKDPARLLVPCSPDRLRAWPVSTRVNSQRNNDAELVLPLA